MENSKNLGFSKVKTVNATLKRKADYELALQKAKQRLYEVDPVF